MENDEFKDLNSKKNRKLYAFNILLIISIFLALFIYILNVEGIDNIKKLLETADYAWVAIGIICLVGMWLAEAITIQIPLKKIYPNQTLKNSFKITMIGQLFNNLTPFASGGQLMQAYVMHKEGKRTSSSLSILTMRFIITQATLIIFTILVTLSQFNFFVNIFKDLVWIGVIGILLNVLLVALFLLAGIKKEFIFKISKPIINLGSKIHIGKFIFVKNKEKTLESFEESVTNFSIQFKNMAKEKKVVISMIIVGLIQSILYYAITYTVYKTFGNSGATFLQVITTQAFLMLIMSVFPTPGAGLGAEGGFLLLFSSVFANGTINLSILFWRIYVFYLPILVGALFFIPTFKKFKKSKANP